MAARIAGDGSILIYARILLFSFMLTALPAWHSAFAKGETGIPEPGACPVSAREVICEGKVEMTKGESVESARERAMEEGRRQAILEAARPLVHPVLFSREGEYIGKVLAPHRSEILGETRVLREESGCGGTYGVRLAVMVMDGPVADLLAKGVHKKRLLIAFPEKGEGRVYGSGSLKEGFVSLAKKRGFQTVDLPAGAGSGLSSAPALPGGPDKEAVRRLCTYYLAGAVIKGSLHTAFSEETAGIYSSRAGGTLRIDKIGGTTATVAVTDVKGFGSNEKKACSDGAHKASAMLAAKAMKSLSVR